MVRLRGTRQKSEFFPIVASFVCYYSLILGTGEIGTFRELRGPVTGTSSNLANLVHSGQFSMLLLTDFGSRGGTNILVLRGQLCVLLLTNFWYGVI